MGTRDRGADPYATDAREFLRKRLIGREVAVKMEYNRKVAPAGAANMKEDLAVSLCEVAGVSPGGQCHLPSLDVCGWERAHASGRVEAG